MTACSPSAAFIPLQMFMVRSHDTEFVSAVFSHLIISKRNSDSVILFEGIAVQLARKVNATTKFASKRRFHSSVTPYIVEYCLKEVAGKR